MLKNKNKVAGQSLIELIIGLTIGAIIIGGVSVSIFVGMRSNLHAKQELTAAQLGQRVVNIVQAVSEANWNTIYINNKGPTHSYFPAPSGDSFVILPGVNTAIVDGVTYNYLFWIENVLRDASGSIVSSGGIDDPSTQKILVRVFWNVLGNPREIIIQSYITRDRNNSSRFTDWSAGSGQEGSVTLPNNGFSSAVNIDHLGIPGAIKIMGF